MHQQSLIGYGISEAMLLEHLLRGINYWVFEQ